MSEQNKAVVRNIINECWNKRNANLAADFFSSNCVIQTPDGELRGVEGAKQLLSAYATGFPDFQISIGDVIAEGDKVVLRYTFSGTNSGSLGGGRPTGKRVSTSGISLFSLAGGKVSDAKMEWDRVALREQLGLLSAA